MRKQTLIVGALLVIFGVWPLAATKNQVAEIKSSLLKVGRGAYTVTTTPSVAQVTDGFTKPLALHQMTRADYDGEMATIDAAVQATDLSALTAAGDQVEKTWGAAGGDQYGLLMAEVAFRIANYFNDFPLSQKYATFALSHADSFSVGMETHLLGFSTRDVLLGVPGDDASVAWNKERSTKAKLWLHAWQRLETQIDRNFDFSKRPSTVMPPEETGLPAGVNPEAIKNSTLRAKYEEAIAANMKLSNDNNFQLKLRELDQKFPKDAEDYLIGVYSQPPYRIPELIGYLRSYRIDEATAERLLTDVQKKTLGRQ